MQRGQISRARQELIAALAPRNAATLEALQGRHPQEPTSAIPREGMDYQPTSPAVGFESVREVFAGSHVWLFSRPLGDVQTRCSASVWTITSCSSCCSLPAKTSPEDSSAHGGPSVDGGHHDNIAETRRGGGGERNRHWHGFQEARCQVFGTTVCQNCGISLFAIPIRTVHKNGTNCVGHFIGTLTDANPALTVTSTTAWELSVTSVGARCSVSRWKSPHNKDSRHKWKDCPGSWHLVQTTQHCGPVYVVVRLLQHATCGQRNLSLPALTLSTAKANTRPQKL